uniref:RGS domain-containing protein n=1 Tax=Globodera pallida TaxID=36090 RepID=A0A183BL06_GLOPA
MNVVLIVLLILATPLCFSQRVISADEAAESILYEVAEEIAAKAIAAGTNAAEAMKGTKATPNEMRGVKDPEMIRKGVSEVLKKYGVYVNLSCAAMGKLREATTAKMPDFKGLEEIYTLLENDQLPRFRRSELYQGFLKKILSQ